MQRFSSQTERSGRFRQSAFLLFLISALAAGAVGQFGVVSVGVHPSNPTTEHGITLLLSGEWKDSCTLTVKELRRAGGSITVHTKSWPGICLTVITVRRWREDVPTAQDPPTVHAPACGRQAGTERAQRSFTDPDSPIMARSASTVLNRR